MSKRRGSLFQHLGLRARIMSLAAVPLIGLLAVAVMGQIAERRQATVEAAYESKRVAVEALSGFASDLAKMRITSEAYRQRPDAEGLEAFNASASAAAAMLKELEAKGGTATAADIRPFLTAYVDDFRALVKQLKENGLTTSDGMLGAVAFAGLKAKGELSIREGELGAWAGTLRDVLSEIMIAERDFRATQMNSHATHFERLHDNLNKILNVSQLGSESRKELVSAFSEYKAKFGDWVDGVQHVMTLANRHAADYTGISNRVSAARTAAISSMVEARNAAAEVASSRENWTLGLFGVVIALSLVIASTIGISAARELAGLSASMRRLAEGDAEVQIPAINRNDEVGTMAAALTALRDGVRERLALVSRNESVSSERLARAQDVERAIRSFEIEVGEALAGLHDASEAMRQVSHELDAAAVEAEAQAISAGGDTSRAANEIETASVAAQQLSSSVDEVAGQAVKSDQAAGEALREVERAALAMGELTSQADRIGEIIGVISSIASQTNLLALNATIEAARAGEAGRGFAVVAAEVKELANQTGSATGEIAGQIEGIRSAAKGVIAAVTSLNGTISEVSRIAGSVAAAVEEQSTALSGISGNIVAASEGAMRGAEGIRTVEVAISDTSRSASRMRDVSEKLSVDAARLNNKVGWFLNEVRAA